MEAQKKYYEEKLKSLEKDLEMSKGISEAFTQQIKLKEKEFQDKVAKLEKLRKFVTEHDSTKEEKLSLMKTLEVELFQAMGTELTSDSVIESAVSFLEDEKSGLLRHVVPKCESLIKEMEKELKMLDSQQASATERKEEGETKVAQLEEEIKGMEECAEKYEKMISLDKNRTWLKSAMADYTADYDAKRSSRKAVREKAQKALDAARKRISELDPSIKKLKAVMLPLPKTDEEIKLEEGKKIELKKIYNELSNGIKYGCLLKGREVEHAWSEVEHADIMESLPLLMEVFGSNEEDIKECKEILEKLQ